MPLTFFRILYYTFFSTKVSPAKRDNIVYESPAKSFYEAFTKIRRLKVHGNHAFNTCKGVQPLRLVGLFNFSQQRMFFKRIHILV